MGYIYNVDGIFVPEDEAAIPVSDLSIQRGYGAFDFLRTYGGRPFYLEAHLRRLYRSAELIGIVLSLPMHEMACRVNETLKKNGFPECGIRIIVTGGPSPDFITPECKPHIIIMTSALKQKPVEWEEAGIPIITRRVTRFAPDAKSTNYLPAINMLRKAREKGAVEALFMDSHGKVMEGTTSNVFAVLGNRLLTPGTGVLPGVTREVILHLARQMLPVEFSDLNYDLLTRQADEIFISSSTKEILPVVSIDGKPVRNGKPGENTRQLIRSFRKHKTDWADGKQDESFLKDYLHQVP